MWTPAENQSPQVTFQENSSSVNVLAFWLTAINGRRRPDSSIYAKRVLAHVAFCFHSDPFFSCLFIMANIQTDSAAANSAATFRYGPKPAIT